MPADDEAWVAAQLTVNRLTVDDSDGSDGSDGSDDRVQGVLDVLHASLALIEKWHGSALHTASIARFELLEPEVSGSVYQHLVVRSYQTGLEQNSLSVDFDLCDSQGNVWASVSGYVLRERQSQAENSALVHSTASASTQGNSTASASTQDDSTQDDSTQSELLEQVKDKLCEVLHQISDLPLEQIETDVALEDLSLIHI